MKTKKVFITLGLALTMGLGMAAAIGASKQALPAKAATVTVYAKMEHSWWTQDGAAIGIYCWGSGDPKAAFPGERMTSVDSSQGLWSFDIDIAAYPNVIFTRVNGSGAVENWGAQTKNLAFPTDGKNLFTISNSSATWGGNPGCDGEWSTYGGGAVITTFDVTTKVEQPNGNIVTDTVQVAEGGLPVAPTVNYGQKFSGWFSDANYTPGNEVTEITSNTTVYGKISHYGTKAYKLDISEVSEVFTNPYIYSWDDHGSNGGWPGQELGGLNISVPSSAKIIITDGATTGTKQTVDITQSGVNNDKLIIHNNLVEGKYTYEWESDILGENNFSLKYRGSDYDFALADEGKPEGVLHQFVVTLTNGFRGELLEFYKGENKITEHIGVDYSEGQPVADNNVVGDVTNGFRIYHYKQDMQIYLKTYSDGGMSLWGTGYSENTFYMSHNSRMLNLDEEFTPYGDYIKQYRTTNPVSISALAENAEKYYISDEAGHNQSLEFETAGDNNAYKATSPTGWFNVHNDCNEVVYLKMKADLSLVLYIGGRTHARSLIIGGVEHQLEAYQPEGQSLQYRVTNVDLTAGQTISYRFDGEAEDITAKAIGNNNLTSDLKVFADVEGADLYLDPENMTLWVSGLGLEGATGFHLLITNATNETVQFLKMTQNPNNENEYFSAAHAFLADDVIQIVDCSHADALPAKFNPKGGLNNFTIAGYFGVNDDDQVVCYIPVTCNAYIQLAYQNDKLYFGEVSSAVAEALEFADFFRSQMSNSCGVSNDKQSAVETAWAACATTYDTLSADAKVELGKGGYSDYQDIKDFAERYISIKTQHSDWDLDNFMGWDIPTSNVINHVLNKSNSVLLVILIAGFISLTSLGVFFILKKKHQ